MCFSSALISILVIVVVLVVVAILVVVVIVVVVDTSFRFFISYLKHNRIVLLYVYHFS